jgi:hypothetical protein
VPGQKNNTSLGFAPSLARIAIGLFAIAILAAAGPADAQLLSDKKLRERMAVFGPDFVVEALPGPEITDPAVWVRRPPGDYVYRFVLGDDDGEATHVEREVPHPEEGHARWQRVISDRLIESFVREPDKDVLIVEEVDHDRGVRVVIMPGAVVPAEFNPGDIWAVEADLEVFDIYTGEFQHHGELKSTVTYEGAFRVCTPAGQFDTVLVREDFRFRIGPLKAEDDRFLFYAKDVGLVAEIEGIRASAMLFVRIKEDRAKLLEARPGAKPGSCQA